jgi:hypothetical protein
MGKFDCQMKKTGVMWPLSDSVISAIFSEVKSAGLAAGRLIGFILKADDVEIGKVTNVTPQKIFTMPEVRGCRVDILVKTSDNEKIIVEVQIYRDQCQKVNMVINVNKKYVRRCHNNKPFFE